MKQILDIRGFKVWKSLLSRPDQQALVDALRPILQAAPLFSPQTPYGRAMTVRMTSAGRFGWFSDRSGYRYTESHPNGTPWPAIPALITDIWTQVTGLDRAPDCCLINFYGADAKLSLHQDRDEADFNWPVVSISLGDDGLFRIGNTTRGGKTEKIWLQSGDIVVMGGDARLTYHGLDRIRFGSSSLLNKGGRINLTLRVVT